MEGCGGLWRVVGGCGGLWRVVEGCGGLWGVVEGCGGLWGVVEGCGGLWRVVEGCGGLWRVVEGCGGLWGVVEGCGGLWRVVEGCGGSGTRICRRCHLGTTTTLSTTTALSATRAPKQYPPSLRYGQVPNPYGTYAQGIFDGVGLTCSSGSCILGALGSCATAVHRHSSPNAGRGCGANSQQTHGGAANNRKCTQLEHLAHIHTLGPNRIRSHMNVVHTPSVSCASRILDGGGGGTKAE